MWDLRAELLPAAAPSSNFQAGMWSWNETPTESSSWGEQAGWPPGASGHAHGRPHRPYGQNVGREWHQGGHHRGRQNHGPANSQGQKRNKKEPEFSHFCDTCERGFKNQDKYDEHMAQHVKCSVPDCSFTAHEKIVSIHWRNNHAPGTKRIKLDTAEEIAKWKEERRKNYPTLQNIEKKKKVMVAREETGGVLETAQFGRMRGRGRGRGQGRGRGRGWGNRGFQEQQPQGPHPPNSRVTERPPPISQPGRDGDPLGALASSDHESDREDPAAESRTGSLVVAPKRMSSALGSLVANYGSSSDSESDEEPESAPIQKAKDLLQENQLLLNTLTPGHQSQDRGPHTSMEVCHKQTQPSCLTLICTPLTAPEEGEEEGAEEEGEEEEGAVDTMMRCRSVVLLYLRCYSLQISAMRETSSCSACATLSATTSSAWRAHLISGRGSGPQPLESVRSQRHQMKSGLCPSLPL
ncbi:unnamed protein product [Pleuronectes platessa]|uniref:C2H2-type domain-containing protein n=1 Tax=Pleuronectes platessa TaxID=8262 RepID=A0A9N7U1E2_PLEPL|nr:unnamed protein product [Pleuronectes platessa]